MIDAVRIEADLDDPALVAGRFERPRDTRRADGLIQTSGYVGPLRVSVLVDTLRGRGSLPLLLQAPTTLGRADVRRAREVLEDRLDVDLGGARVYGLEVSADLLVSRPVAVYLPLLLRVPGRFKRSCTEHETVSFNTAIRSLVFYDRVVRQRGEHRKAVKRAHSRGWPVPPAPVPLGSYVLRYEVQFKKGLRRQLGEVETVTLADLHGEALWGRLVDRWVKEYESVEKARLPVALAGQDVRKACQLAGSISLGHDLVTAEILAQAEAGVFSRRTKTNLLGRFRELRADPALTREDERAAELDGLVAAAASAALAT